MGLIKSHGSRRRFSCKMIGAYESHENRRHFLGRQSRGPEKSVICVKSINMHIVTFSLIEYTTIGMINSNDDLDW